MKNFMGKDGFQWFVGAVEDRQGHVLGQPVLGRHCPGRKPPFLAVKRPARPYKSPIQNGLSQENAKEREGHLTVLGGRGQGSGPYVCAPSHMAGGGSTPTGSASSGSGSGSGSTCLVRAASEHRLLLELLVVVRRHPARSGGDRHSLGVGHLPPAMAAKADSWSGGSRPLVSRRPPRWLASGLQ